MAKTRRRGYPKYPNEEQRKSKYGMRRNAPSPRKGTRGHAARGWFR